MAHRSALVGLVAVSLAACSPPPEPRGSGTTDAPQGSSATPKRPETTPSTSSIPTSVQSSQGREGSCKVDADCQVVSSCDCQRCVASIAMHVDPCPTVCERSPCDRVVAACEAGTCVARPAAPAPGAIACKSDADCPTLPCGPCVSGTPITRELASQECAVNPCKNAGATCDASRRCVVR
ncbi:MAG: hypothetical protein U0414_26485 [Polyangiaceae bacterium]